MEAPNNSETTSAIPSIYCSITKEEIKHFQPFHVRYFTEKYCTAYSKDNINLDTCIRVHTNKICLVFLSPKHTIVEKAQRISKVDFQINAKVNRAVNVMSGKGKRGAQIVYPDSPLCYITTEDGGHYTVRAGIQGKLLEVNDRIKSDCNIIADNLNEGYIAVILPAMQKFEENIQNLINKEDYN